MAADTKQDNVTWNTVSEPAEETPQSKIVFDTIGDQFTGTFIGSREINGNDGSYTQFLFEQDGTRFFTNANYSMREGMRKVRRGSLVRLTFSGELDTGQDSLMKQFTVQVGTVSRSGRTGENS